MMKKTLIWNNKRSEDMGLKIISLPPIQLSTENINEIEIEGRDGTLTEFDGYTSDTKQVEADYRGSNTLAIPQWLKGKGEVIFGNVPDRYYKARINNVVPLEQIIENQMYNFTIQFRCQPFGYLLDGKETLTITNGSVLNHNKATYKSLPIITIYGTGSCTFAINGRSFTISEIGTSITIDSDIQDCYNEKGDKMSGYFPYLDVGENTISWIGAGVTKVEITPNWRAL
jgi:phage-related protein